MFVGKGYFIFSPVERNVKPLILLPLHIYLYNFWVGWMLT